MCVVAVHTVEFVARFAEPSQRLARLLRRLAVEQGARTAVALYGSLKNMAARLLESVRYLHWPSSVYDEAAAARIQIRLDNSG